MMMAKQLRRSKTRCFEAMAAPSGTFLKDLKMSTGLLGDVGGLVPDLQASYLYFKLEIDYDF